jgi:competence protein ComEC
MVMWFRARLAGWRGVAILAFAVVLIWLAGRGLPDGRLHVYFLDVGQGDAIFVRTPDGHQVLIDGGPSPSAVLAELPSLMPFWDHSLDLLVLTHPDQDHMAGLLGVLERYHVDRAVDAVAADDPAGDPWREGLTQAGVRAVPGLRGTRLAAGGVVLSILHPGPVPLTGTPADDNNNSLVLRLDYGKASFLLTGDAEAEAEADLVRAGQPLKADVLKVGHHGSRRSSTAPFLVAVAPRLAVIQVGSDNRFGHPHPEVLERLGPATILRTDLNGRVEVISDGEQLWTQTVR